MKVAGGFHLTYCSNIHPGESWQAVSEALSVSLPRVRRHLHADGPLAIGLRLSALAAETLDTPAAFEAFREFLREGNYYVPTMNGFPYGAFHGGRVKERVYLPDWRDQARVDYSNRLARLLAALLTGQPEIDGSVSTVPGAFGPSIRSGSDVEAVASGILRHAAFLRSLRETTGVAIVLALEPEPACLLETVGDVTAFFEDSLFDRHAVSAASAATRMPLTIDDVRRHVGVCLDACHLAVEFEDPAAALRRLGAAGIRIAKVQISSALEVDVDRGERRTALLPFAEDTYLHQVVERTPAGLARFTDLPEALAAAGASGSAPDVWRIHFHVPVFLSSAGPFKTTQPVIVALIDLLKRDPVCRCLEVETYTWDVLPPDLRTGDVCAAIARELTWVRSALES